VPLVRIISKYKRNKSICEAIFTVRRPQGDYAVRSTDSERASDILPTQREAIERARELNSSRTPQYDQLEQEKRKLARRTGRQLLIEFGSIAKAIMAPTNHVVQETVAAKSAPITPRSRSREEQFLRNLSRWSPLTPPCPSCRMGCGFPKRSWLTR
jgi:hypothetical protein